MNEKKKKNNTEEVVEKTEIKDEEKEVNKEVDKGVNKEVDKEVDKKANKKLKEAQEINEKLQKEYDEVNDKYKRLAAEYDNYRKRTQREKEALYTDALCDFATTLVPVLDSMDRAAAVDASSSDSKSIQDGVILIYKQLKDLLTKAGMTEIEAVGKQFNPDIHNAIMHVEDESLEANVIVEEFQKGYKMKEKVIRHSMVKVAN